jgi:hypothetical protein
VTTAFIVQVDLRTGHVLTTLHTLNAYRYSAAVAEMKETHAAAIDSLLQELEATAQMRETLQSAASGRGSRAVASPRGGGSRAAASPRGARDDPSAWAEDATGIAADATEAAADEEDEEDDGDDDGDRLDGGAAHADPALAASVRNEVERQVAVRVAQVCVCVCVCL